MTLENSSSQIVSTFVAFMCAPCSPPHHRASSLEPAAYQDRAIEELTVFTRLTFEERTGRSHSLQISLGTRRCSLCHNSTSSSVWPQRLPQSKSSMSTCVSSSPDSVRVYS